MWLPCKKNDGWGERRILKTEYSKTLVCEHNSFWKHACNPKHLYIKANFKNHWLTCGHVTFGITYYSYCKTCLFIKLKFIRNVCSSCRTVAEQVICDPRFYCTAMVILLLAFPPLCSEYLQLIKGGVYFLTF